jgi:hypothetical protein
MIVALKCYRNDVSQGHFTRILTIGNQQQFTKIMFKDPVLGIQWEWVRDTRDFSWKMQKPLEWPANPFAMEQILSGLNALNRSSYAGKRTEISSPGTFFENKKCLSFFSSSGKWSFLCDEDYVWEEGQKLPIVLPEEWKFIKDPSLKELLKAQLWDLDLSQIDGVLLEFPKKGQKYILKKEKGVWILAGSSLLKLSTDKVNAFLSSVLALEVDQFLPEQMENVLILGFQIPDCRLTLLCGHEPHVLEIGKSFYKKSHLRFAKLTPYEIVLSLPCDFLRELSDPQAFMAEDREDKAL